jgi:hypothetical protein
MLLENHKNLLFKPAALNKEYLSGKRLSYLALVRFYIFSFITFLLIAIFPVKSILQKKLSKRNPPLPPKNKRFNIP